MKKILVFLISLLISTLTLFVANYLIITPLIIGDKCNNDLGQNELTKFNELFFEISSNTGYHPEPTTFILTAIIGCIIGSIVYKILTR